MSKKVGASKLGSFLGYDGMNSQFQSILSRLGVEQDNDIHPSYKKRGLVVEPATIKEITQNVSHNEKIKDITESGYYSWSHADSAGDFSSDNWEIIEDVFSYPKLAMGSKPRFICIPDLIHFDSGSKQCHIYDVKSFTKSEGNIEKFIGKDYKKTGFGHNKHQVGLKKYIYQLLLEGKIIEELYGYKIKSLMILAVPTDKNVFDHFKLMSDDPKTQDEMKHLSDNYLQNFNMTKDDINIIKYDYKETYEHYKFDEELEKATEIYDKYVTGGDVFNVYTQEVSNTVKQKDIILFQENKKVYIEKLNEIRLKQLRPAFTDEEVKLLDPDWKEPKSNEEIHQGFLDEVINKE